MKNFVASSGVCSFRTESIGKIISKIRRALFMRRELDTNRRWIFSAIYTWMMEPDFTRVAGGLVTTSRVRGRRSKIIRGDTRARVVARRMHAGPVVI